MIRGLAVPCDAVTLWPEWAFAFAYLGKAVENREWPLRAEHLPLSMCIHAGVSIGGPEREGSVEEGLEALEHHASAAGWALSIERRGSRVAIGGRNRDGRMLPSTLVATRAIVAVAVFDRVERVEPSLMVDPSDPWKVGPVCWRACRVVPLLRPVLCNGAPKIWCIDAELFGEISAVLADSVVAQARAEQALRTG